MQPELVSIGGLGLVLLGTGLAVFAPELRVLWRQRRQRRQMRVQRVVDEAIAARLAEIDRVAKIKAAGLVLEQAAAIGPLVPGPGDIRVLADDMARSIEAVLAATGGCPERYALGQVQLDTGTYCALVALLVRDPRTMCVTTTGSPEAVLAHRVLAMGRARWSA